MALTCGTKLGPFEIQSPLGAGGMGEVYRARDLRLGRDVAIKVLPSSLASDPSLKERLEREAKAISKLSHPHICTLHDIGHQDGVDFLVMELVEGQTLEQQLQKGALPLDAVLRYGTQIADALAHAHKLGFTHRDLKPSNIMITKSGAKLMDFGLAKHSATTVLGAPTELTAEHSKLTSAGMLVGTFQYIAPEQLEGKEADSRSDIFAFGEVLYEMVTGKPAFSGKSGASLIAAILTADPTPINQLQPLTPLSLERIVRKCLAKDPDDRWQNARDLATELLWISDPGSQTTPARRGTRRQSGFLWLALGLVLGAAVSALLASLFLGRTNPPSLRVAINIPSGSHLALDKQIALSPDGQSVAMVLADGEGKTRLWVRQLDKDRPQPVPGTDGAMQPFWSPDSKFLAFFTFFNLKRANLSDDTVQTLCDTAAGIVPSGGTWNREGVIIFSLGQIGLYRIPSSGGTPNKVAVQGNYRWPSFLPDGRHLLVLSNRASEGISVLALDDGTVKAILPQETGPARYAEPGYIVFVRQENVLAQPFNARTLQIAGSAFTVAESSEFGPLSFSPAASSLVHVEVSKTQLAWLDREGNFLSAVGEPGYVSSPFLSPDGRYAIASITDRAQLEKLWLFDFQRGTSNPFTFGTGNDAYPVWSPDGREVAFSSIRDNGQEDVFLKPVSGGGPEQPLLTQPGDKEPDKFSPDGRFLLFDYRPHREDPFEVWVSPMFGDRKPYPLVRGNRTNAYATFSPDGKWVAYQSDESGQTEIYVVPFGKSGGKWQVSKGGGGQPFWPRGNELFYVTNDFRMVAVEFEVHGSDFLVGKSRPLAGRAVNSSLSVNPDASASIDIALDGTRWLVAMPVDARNASPVVLTTNWTSKLAK